MVTRYDYHGNSTTVTDGRGHSKVTTENVQGKTATVKEGGGTSTITFTYDAIGNLRETNTNDKVIKMTYDAHGNKISMDDPSMGKWTYVYNAFGELMRQKDAKGQTIYQYYDRLGRLIKRTNKEGTSTWTFDKPRGSQNKFIGKLAFASNKHSKTEYFYDHLGRPMQTQRRIHNDNFISKVTYDRYSRPTEETYPSGMSVKRYYTETGHLQRITTPKSNIVDYDYDQLTQVMKALEKEIIVLNERVNDETDSFIKLSKQADHYRATALKWEAEALAAEKNGNINEAKRLQAEADKQQQKAEDKLTQAQQQASNSKASNQEEKKQALQHKVEELKTHARQLQALAQGHLERAEQYRKMAHNASRRYGNLVFKLQKQTAGNAQYQASQQSCSGKGKNQNCSTTYYNIRIPQIDFQAPCDSGSSQAGKAWCAYGPPNQINLANFYNTKAAQHQAYAASLKQQQSAIAKKADALANSSTSELTDLARRSAEKARLGIEYLKEQRRRLADYQAVQDEIERVLDEQSQGNRAEVLLWAATSKDAANRLRGEVAGNGLITRREYDPYSGQLNRIVTGIENGRDVIRDLRYAYDATDNVTARHDLIQGYADTYSYDAFDRLETATYKGETQGSESLNYRYDIHGNMTQKAGATLSYDGNNRLTSFTKNGKKKSYRYDANGNMTQSGDRTLTWTSFNKPHTIKRGKTTVPFSYDANQQRIQQIKGTDGRSETTLYVSKAYEITHSDIGVTQRKTQHKHHIYAGGKVVAIQIKTTQAGQRIPDQTRYLHHDSLGNVDTITNSSAEVIQRIAFKPFGEREVTYSREGTDAWTNRGFTGHEHLQELGLIHMNARLYDPETARFLSPDIYIQAPTMSQNYNRYVYVMNNPLKYTDPSGHFFKRIFRAVKRALKRIAKFLNKNIGMIMGMIAAFTLPVGGLSILQAAFAKGAAAGFAAGLVGTGSIKGALQGALWGGVSALVAGYIGRNIAKLGAWGTRFAHGVSQGVITELRGGKFKSGFVGAFIAKLSPASSWVQQGLFNLPIRTVAAAVFGGLAARATGGSFSDGAMAAAFAHLFNAERSFDELEAEANKLLAEISSLEEQFSNGKKIIFYDSNDPYYYMFDQQGNLTRYYLNLEGNVDAIAPELLAVGGVLVGAGKAASHLVVRISNAVLANPTKTTVGVVETVDFAAGRYAPAQGLIAGPGSQLGSVSTILFPVEDYEGKLLK